MDLSAQYQQQYIASQTYDPSQVQAYDQSTQAYYAYHHQYAQYNQQQQQQYPYYTQDYTNAHQQQQSQQEPASIHPPGVPILPDSTHVAGSEQGFGQTHVQNQQNSYYPQGVVDQHQQQEQLQQLNSSDSAGQKPTAAAAVAALSQLTQFSGNMDSAQRAVTGVQGSNEGFGPVPMHSGPRPPIGQSPYRGAGRRGGRSFRGGGRGHFGPRPDGSAPPFRGRGRGWGRGRHFPPNSASAPAEDPTTLTQGELPPPQALMLPPYASGFGQAPLPAAGQEHPTPMWPAPRMAWCELCRVDCNTLEILEQHRNGKRHKKNLQVYEELQKINKLLVGEQNEQTPTFEFEPKVSDHPVKVERSEDKQPAHENLSSQAVTIENKVETEQQKVSEGAEPARKPRVDHFEARGRGFKRKMRGGRGGKWMRTYEGSRRPVEPPKPKEVIPLICELCNVKCDSVVVFESHLTGKKHLSNLKRFQGHQAMLGQAALQALYPALQALYPALQALCQPNANASTSFAPQFQQEDIHGPQGFFAQPGPSVFPLGQASTPGSATTFVSAPPLVLETKNPQDSKHQGSTSGGGSPSAVTGEAKNQQQSVTINFEAARAESIDIKFENGTSKFGLEEVNLATDNSVVVPLGNTVTERVLSGTAMDAAAVNPGSESVPSDQSANPESGSVSSDQVARPGLDSKMEKLDSRSEKPTE